MWIKKINLLYRLLPKYYVPLFNLFIVVMFRGSIMWTFVQHGGIWHDK